VTGVKTGHTFGALYVLVGSGQRDGVSLISTVVGTWTDEERFDDSLALLEYGFSQYQRRLPIKRGQSLVEPEIRWSGGRLPLRAERSLQVGVRKGEEVDVRVQAPQEVEGPIERGVRLGTATILVEGRRAGVVPLRAGRSIPEASFFDRARATVADNLIPIGIVAFVILMAAVLLLLRRRTRGNDL
jgi:D-alanyl-D-alanine carboxypeptidase (penicillin-binding protein 5/6)